MFLQLFRKDRKLFFGGVFLVFLVIFFVKTLSKRDAIFKDYLQASAYVKEEEKGIKGEVAEKLVKNRPELQPYFVALLGQRFLLQGNLEKAEGVVRDCLKRVSFLPAGYREYANISLLIEKGLYLEALDRSCSLPCEDTTSYLYRFNQIRIAFLKDCLQKKGAWKELGKLFSEEDKKGNRLMSHLQEEHLSLLQFLSSLE